MISWIALGATLVAYFILWQLQKRHISFGVRTLVAFCFGLVIGFGFMGHTAYITPLGQVFTRLINSIVIPLLFFSIIHSVASLNDMKRLKSLGVSAVFWLLLNTVIAAAITLALTTYFKVGSGFHLPIPEGFEAREVPTFIQTILNFIPNNLIAQAADNQIIPIIVFSLMVGVALVKINSKTPEKVAPFISFINAANEVIFGVVKSIIRLTPYAVVSFMASAITRDSQRDLASFIWVIVIGFGVSFFHAFVVDGVLVKVFAKMNPITFFKAIWPAQVVAFTTQSSLGTVPVSINQLTTELGVKEDTASFVAGLGANMGMPACTGMWPILLAVFTINALNIPFTTTQYLLLIVYSVVVSFGTAGVPGSATIAATAVLASAGLPLQVIFILSPVSAIIDMARTMANVTGAAASTVIVAHREKRS